MIFFSHLLAGLNVYFSSCLVLLLWAVLIGVFAKRVGIKPPLVKDNERSHRVFINYTQKLGYFDDRLAYYQLTSVTLITF